MNPLHQSWLAAEALLAAAERLRHSINQRRAERQDAI